MDKRQFVLDAFDNKPTDRVPVSFWMHFVPEGLNSPTPSHIAKNIACHQAYYDDVHPDFLKLMSDGYFWYPNQSASQVHNAKDLDSVSASRPTEWIDAQVALVKELTGRFGNEVLCFYNIFAPGSYFEYLQRYQGSPLRLKDLVDKNPDGVAHTLNEIAKDVADLARRVIAEGGADGIYLSVRNIREHPQTKEEYLRTIAPSELAVLNAANELSDYNLLHICGYQKAKNDLSFYTEYPAKVINYAGLTEGVTLSQGKRLFGGKAIIGGFGQTRDDIIYTGNRDEICAYTRRLLDEAGCRGVILGADCTIPGDTPYEHLQWIKEAAADYRRCSSK